MSNRVLVLFFSNLVSVGISPTFLHCTCLLIYSSCQWLHLRDVNILFTTAIKVKEHHCSADQTPCTHHTLRNGKERDASVSNYNWLCFEAYLTSCAAEAQRRVSLVGWELVLRRTQLASCGGNTAFQSGAMKTICLVRRVIHVWSSKGEGTPHSDVKALVTERRIGVLMA